MQMPTGYCLIDTGAREKYRLNHDLKQFYCDGVWVNMRAFIANAQHFTILWCMLFQGYSY
ncbi:hypothetical protein P3491_25755, partial [Vibrio parahaemolyticus]|nr:hypothetical protein [Vibrio parahaemolyticus]